MDLNFENNYRLFVRRRSAADHDFDGVLLPKFIDLRFDSGQKGYFKDNKRGPQTQKPSLFIKLGFLWSATIFINGAEGETRTPTGNPRLDPEPSASTSSATSAINAFKAKGLI
jgi:hypothetical protein